MNVSCKFQDNWKIGPSAALQQLSTNFGRFCQHRVAK